MSTLNSFFRARKSRNTSINKDKTLKCTEGESTKQSFAVQAPQPVYESLPKQQTIAINTCKKSTTTTTKQNNKNSILYYLSPVNKKTPHADTKETTTTTPPSPCQIRRNIPANHVWSIILEEFDPQSQSNQFDGSPSPSPTVEKAELFTANNMLMADGTNRRRKLEQEQTDTSRCVRIRTVGPLSSSIDIFCIEDCLLEDINEDLSRPLRYKHTFKESNLFYMEMLESLDYPE